MTTATTDLDACLRERFGLDHFRPGQREVIDTVLARRGCGDAIKTSWQLMTSNPLGAFGAAILAMLMGMAGALACCVGVVYALPAIQCMIAAIYRTATPPRMWTQPPTVSAPPVWPSQPAGPAAPLPPPPSMPAS